MAKLVGLDDNLANLILKTGLSQTEYDTKNKAAKLRKGVSKWDLMPFNDDDFAPPHTYWSDPWAYIHQFGWQDGYEGNYFGMKNIPTGDNEKKLYQAKKLLSASMMYGGPLQDKFGNKIFLRLCPNDGGWDYLPKLNVFQTGKPNNRKAFLEQDFRDERDYDKLDNIDFIACEIDCNNSHTGSGYGKDVIEDIMNRDEFKISANYPETKHYTRFKRRYIRPSDGSLVPIIYRFDRLYDDKIINFSSVLQALTVVASITGIGAIAGGLLLTAINFATQICQNVIQNGSFTLTNFSDYVNLGTAFVGSTGLVNDKLTADATKYIKSASNIVGKYNGGDVLGAVNELGITRSDKANEILSWAKNHEIYKIANNSYKSYKEIQNIVDNSNNISLPQNVVAKGNDWEGDISLPLKQIPEIRQMLIIACSGGAAGVVPTTLRRQQPNGSYGEYDIFQDLFLYHSKEFDADEHKALCNLSLGLPCGNNVLDKMLYESLLYQAGINGKRITMPATLSAEKRIVIGGLLSKQGIDVELGQDIKQENIQKANNIKTNKETGVVYSAKKDNYFLNANRKVNITTSSSKPKTRTGNYFL